MHLDTETALDMTEGRLDEDRQAFWRRHMEVCAKCAKDVLHWREITSNLRRSHLLSAPADDVANAVNVFVPREKVSAVRSILAAIVFDSFLQPAPAGVRGSSANAARQLVMRAEEFDIHIKIWGDGFHKQMLGQLLPRHNKDFVSAARFHLLYNGERFESTTNDQTGEFRFRNVPDGDLSLQIDLPNLTVIGALNVQRIP
jgi:hypothetical protein